MYIFLLFQNEGHLMSTTKIQLKSADFYLIYFFTNVFLFWSYKNFCRKLKICYHKNVSYFNDAVTCGENFFPCSSIHILLMFVICHFNVAQIIYYFVFKLMKYFLFFVFFLSIYKNICFLFEKSF